jgi:cullin 1
MIQWFFNAKWEKFKLNTTLQKLKDLHGEQLLQEYTRIWESYRFGSTVVNGIFSYLNRHWIRREIDEGKNGVYEVYNVSDFAKSTSRT